MTKAATIETTRASTLELMLGSRAVVLGVADLGPNLVTVSSVRAKAVSIRGSFAGIDTTMMLDSGSSVSLVQQNILTHAVDVARVVPQPQVQLLTASKEPVPVRDYSSANQTPGIDT